jgi:hypothetical protein
MRKDGCPIKTKNFCGKDTKNAVKYLFVMRGDYFE